MTTNHLYSVVVFTTDGEILFERARLPQDDYDLCRIAGVSRALSSMFNEYVSALPPKTHGVLQTELKLLEDRLNFFLCLLEHTDTERLKP